MKDLRKKLGCALNSTLIRNLGSSGQAAHIYERFQRIKNIIAINVNIAPRTLTVSANFGEDGFTSRLAGQKISRSFTILAGKMTIAAPIMIINSANRFPTIMEVFGKLPIDSAFTGIAARLVSTR